MPRHRRERVPRHRARPEAGYPARRAQVTAALPAPRTELDDCDLDGTGMRVAGLDDTGPDATETAPLAALTGALPPRFDGAVAGLAGFAAPDARVLDDSVLDAGVLDDGAAGHGPPGRTAPPARPPGRRPHSHSQRRRRKAVSTTARPALAGQRAGKQGGVARGVLVTPWFAAAAGFVIAASLWIYSPHPQLTFPAIAIGKAPMPCSSHGCGPHVDKQGAGSLTLNSGEPLTQQQNSAGHGAPGQARTAASGLAFGYVVQPTWGGNFEVVISVTGKRAVKNWRLAFVLPGDHIRFVIGAHWQPVGGDGGTASPFTGAEGQQYGGPGGYSGSRVDPGAVNGDFTYGSGHGGTLDQPGVIFSVYASGKPVGPAHCSFDGASCTFRKLSSASQGRH